MNHLLAEFPKISLYLMGLMCVLFLANMLWHLCVYGDMEGQFKEWRNAQEILEWFRKVPRNRENFRLRFDELTDEQRVILLNFFEEASTDDEVFHLVCFRWRVEDTIEDE